MATPAGVFLGLECFGKLTKNQESGERDTFSSLSDMLTTLLTGRNCGNCGETQNLISNMSQTRQKRAKPNLKHKFPFAPRVNVSLYLYWLANVASMLLAREGNNTAGEKGGEVFERWTRQSRQSFTSDMEGDGILDLYSRESFLCFIWGEISSSSLPSKFQYNFPTYFRIYLLKIIILRGPFFWYSESLFFL